MYLSTPKPKRHDSPWRVLILVILIVGGLYVVREQVGGVSWTRPFDAAPMPTRGAESFFEEAELLYAGGMLDESLTAYQRAFTIDPEDNVALFRLARLMVIRGQAAQVLEQYGARLQDEKLGDARTLSVLGMAFDWHALFNTEELLPVYVSLDVVQADEVQASDWAYDPEKMARRLVQAAQRACERAVRLDSDLPEAYAYLSEALTDRDRYEEALAAAATGISLNPNLPDTQRAMAYVYEAQGEYSKAIEFYRAAIEAHAKLDFLHIALGKNYRAIGYRFQLEGRWDDAKPYFDQAVAAFEEAIKVNPQNPVSYDEIGWTYGYYMGDDIEFKRRAVDYLEEALRQNPDYGMAYRHLGQVYYYGLRNYEEAIPNLEKALQIGGLPSVDVAMSHIMLGWSYYVLVPEGKSLAERCENALPHFQSALDGLLKLPQRELELESVAIQGINACK